MVVSAIALSVSPGRRGYCPQVLVPAYFRPGTYDWRGPVSRVGSVGTMVANPASGPGPAPEPAYAGAIRRARRAGIRVLGYVHTSWGNRPVNEVKADIERFESWYRVDGVFLDEAASQKLELPYYAELYRYLRHSPGAFVVLNPGTVPAREYMRVSDVVVTFEGTYRDYVAAHFPRWVLRYAPGRFAHLVYATAARDVPATISLARKRNAANLYITSDTVPNPWDTSPGYLLRERRALIKRCAATL